MKSLLISCAILIIASLFYYRKNKPVDYLKIASFHSTLAWLVVIVALFRFFNDLSLLSPYEDMILFVLGMSGFQVVVWTIAHLLERFVGEK